MTNKVIFAEAVESGFFQRIDTFPEAISGSDDDFQ